MESVASNPPKHKRKKALTIVLCILVFLIVAGLAVVPIAVMPSFLGQRYRQNQHAAEDYGITAQRITLHTDDGLSLAAWRTRAQAPKGTVILISGIQNPSVTAFFGYAKLFADNGWDCLLIEMRARSESEGDEIGLGMTEWRDVKAGVDFLCADPAVAQLPIVAMGTSMGGGTVIIAAGEIPRIDAVITASAFSSWGNLFADNMQLMGIPKFIGIMEIPFVNLYNGFHYGFDALRYSPIKEIKKLGNRPILMMHSTEDTQVPYSEFQQLLNAANRSNIDVTTFIREGDEHFICYEQYVSDPAQDVPFSNVVLDFLKDKFE